MVQLEIACFNLPSVDLAVRAGANRIELCVNRLVGGLSPSPEMLRSVLDEYRIPVYVMIRPVAGDFYYTAKEFEEMKNSIRTFKAMGAMGFVFGILQEDRQIDKERNHILIQLASPLPCTFHKAFDQVPDQTKALETAIELGFKNILSSGQTEKTLQSGAKLQALIQQADNRIHVIPAGGIRSEQLKEIMKEIGAQWIHSSAIVDEGETANWEELEKLVCVAGEEIL